MSQAIAEKDYVGANTHLMPFMHDDGSGRQRTAIGGKRGASMH